MKPDQLDSCPSCGRPFEEVAKVGQYHNYFARPPLGWWFYHEFDEEESTPKYVLDSCYVENEDMPEDTPAR